MRILSRYISKTYLSIFVLTLSAFVGLYVVVDFFEKLNLIPEKQITTTRLYLYFVFQTPNVIVQGIPMASLLATLITLGILMRNREIVAMRAAGLNTWVYAGPILVVALLMAFLDFGVAELVARPMAGEAVKIWEEEVLHKYSSSELKQENIWRHGENVIYEVRFFNPKEQCLEKVTLYYFGPGFRLIRRLDAKRLQWTGGRWIAEDGLILNLEEPDPERRQERFAVRALDLHEIPADFHSVETATEQLNWFDLYHYAGKLRQEGYDATSYLVELYRREAFPLTTFILSLLGTVIALRQGHHGGIATSVGIGLIVALFYLTGLHLGCSMSIAGIIPPVVGVWIADFTFTLIGAYLWIIDPQ